MFVDKVARNVVDVDYPLGADAYTMGPIYSFNTEWRQRTFCILPLSIME
jgi:hypothetical protein